MDLQKGTSFYLFDIDDNILFLPTPIHIYEQSFDAQERNISERSSKEVVRTVSVTTGEFAKIHPFINPKKLALYTVNENSFSSFQDIADVNPEKQSFIQDINKVLDIGGNEWQGPSWDVFVHAVENDRPISFVTARGHHPETIVAGIDTFYKRKVLSKRPNYLGVYPVGNPEIRKELGDIDLTKGTAELKKIAIKRVVKHGIKKYGECLNHRFGMSDDDPSNVKLILKAMTELKKEFPQCYFCVLDTSKVTVTIKTEILEDSFKSELVEPRLNKEALDGPFTKKQNSIKLSHSDLEPDTA